MAWADPYNNLFFFPSLILCLIVIFWICWKRFPCQQTNHTMNRICKQVSIESPACVMGKEYVFSYDVMVPDLPPHGARVKVNHPVFSGRPRFNLQFLYSWCLQEPVTDRDLQVSAALQALAAMAVTVVMFPTALLTVESGTRRSIRVTKSRGL